MTNGLSKERLTEFIRRTLGCACPDAVFEKIESSQIAVDATSGEATRIVVGDRLLLYIILPASMRQLMRNIAEVAAIGRSDRDSHKYNRFRLVVPDDSDDADRARAAASFAAEAGSDEKMHVHFVDPGALRTVMSIARDFA